MRRSLVALLFVVLISALVHGVRRSEPESARHADEPVLVPFVVDGARELVVVDSGLLVCNASGAEDPLVIEELAVSADGIVIHREELDVELAGDRRYAEMNALVERMPEEIAHLHRERRYFAADDVAPFPFEEIADRWTEIDAMSSELRAEYAAGAPRPFVEIVFPLPLDQVFFPDDRPGAEREIRFSIRHRRGTASSTTTISHTITLLPPRRPAPESLAFDLGDVTLHAGDLHVHSCHGEAVNACAPSADCPAESFQTSGSFTYAQLKTQYQALGIDWFTATDHSYCINDGAEYQTIVDETVALTDASFLVVPDIELSSEEQGSQSGSDLADLLCLLGPAQNHMGAHGISSRKEGGSDGFLGFCNGLFSDALEGFLANAAAIRAEGGYPIINHPAASSFAWNSSAATLGIESNQMHGLEIWNGATQSGQDDHVASWVTALLGGRILYAYSGSDTHDEAFEFGANHAVFVNEPFDIDHLESVLKSGRVFVSDGPVLILEVQLDGQSLLMGALQSMSPTQPASTLTTRAHYDFGASTGTITVFRGRVGEGSETILGTSTTLTGSGVFELTDVLDPTSRTHYRAYAETAGAAEVAYANPVFFLPGSCSWSQYGLGLGGANIATLSTDSCPAIGSVNRIDVTGYSPTSTAAMFVYSSSPIPGGAPLAGGYLLITLPHSYLAVEPLAGGAAFHTVQIPFDPAFIGLSSYWQSVALDAGQPAGIAFSSGLAMTVCGLLQ